MSSIDESADEVIFPLENSEPVFRGLRASWYVEGEIDPVAFIRRPSPKDEKGLSVDMRCEMEHIYSSFSCKAIAGLITEAVVAIEQLNIEPDEPQHANITGLPYREDDEKLAEDLASALTDLCYVAWEKPKKIS